MLYSYRETGRKVLFSGQGRDRQFPVNIMGRRPSECNRSDQKPGIKPGFPGSGGLTDQGTDAADLQFLFSGV